MLGRLAISSADVALPPQIFLLLEGLFMTHLQVRNNIMVVVADMCMRYTSLVDGHIPSLAACLSDPDELVRRQGLAVLANLLSKARLL